ncbi:MAG TPA: Ig-like domain-containing protein, partial [Hymenobacter sp.]
MTQTPTVFSWSASAFFRPSRVLSTCAIVLLAGAVSAQTPTVTSLSPARNARSAPRTTDVTVGFNQALSSNASTLGALKVFSQQTGKKMGAATVNGNTLSFNPSTDFKPGERVFTTVSAAAQSTGGTAVTPHVFEFTTATSPSTGVLAGGSNVNLVQGVIDVRLGDVDGDGDLDFISDNPLYNSVRLRLNDGSGSFSGTTEIAVGENPNAAMLADVDGDGDLDLLAANAVNSSVNPSTVSVRLNNGAGSFSGTQNVPVGSFPDDLATGDIDGDGDLDLLTVNHTRTVSIRLNDGAGNFSGT